MLNDTHMIFQTIGRKYDNIILDLRGNTGGSARFAYYFLSFLLGDNDPDMRIGNLMFSTDSEDSEQFLTDYHQEVEDLVNNRPYQSFYEHATFGDPDIPFQKNTKDNITFEKMIVLVDEHTISAGEIVAATLKNTLGSKICILGKPCVGSFEAAGEEVLLPHDFTLDLPDSYMVFYSPKYKKLLTGHRLLPDITHENMDTIMDKALELLHDHTITYPSEPSYERTIQQ
jgi:hypothetical protein